MAASGDMLGAVLVGGESRRMGIDKANLELGGERLGASAVRVLQSELDRVVVVSRRRGEHDDLGAPEIADARPGCGPLGGLHAALMHAGGAPVFVLACDLPAVGRELVAHLIGAATGRGGHTLPWSVLPRQGDRRQPLCGVYSASSLRVVRERLDRGALRMLGLAATLDTTWVDIEPTLPFYRRDLLINVNDRAAAARLALAAE